MSLIHPFIANNITCKEMKFRHDYESIVEKELELYSMEPLKKPSMINFSCPSEKVELDLDEESSLQFEYLFYDFNKFLFVDLYELSINQNTGLGRALKV